MPILSENFDGGVLPSGWTWGSNFSVTNAPSGGISPTSGSYVLASLATNPAVGHFYGIYNTPDTNGGDVSIAVDINPATTSANQVFGLVLRAGGTGITSTSGTYCWAQVLPNGVGARIIDVISGASTTLATTAVTLPAPAWERAIFACSGGAAMLSLQRASDGFWLNSSGSFQATQTTAVMASTSVPAASGHFGLSTQNRVDDSFWDSLVVDNATPAPPPLPFAGRPAPRPPGLASRIQLPTLRPPAVAHRAPSILPVRTALGRTTSRPAARILPPPRPPAPPPAPTPTPWGIGGGRVRSRSDGGNRVSPPGPGGASRLSALPVVDPPPIPGPGACGCCAPKCTCNTTICVQGCGGAKIVGAVVTVAGVGTCITRNISTVDAGCCNFCLPGGAGTYTVTVTAPGYNTYTGSQSLACDGTITITLTPAGTAPPCVTFHVYGCCSGPIAFGGQTGFPLAGATITISGGPTLTTDVNGFAQWCGPTLGSSYAYTVSKSRYADSTGTIDATSCSYQGNMLTITMLPATGFVCLPWSNATSQGAYPVPTTLHLTDSIFGGCVLTWDPADFWWRGTISGSFVGGCGCPAQPCTLTYTLTGCSWGTDNSGTFGSLVQPGFFTASCSGALYGFATCAGTGANFTPFRPPVASCPTSATGDPLDCAHAGGPGFYGPNLFGGGGQVGGFLTDAAGGGCALSETIAMAPPFSATISWSPPGAGGCNGCGGGAQPPGLAWSPGVIFTITE